MRLLFVCNPASGSADDEILGEIEQRLTALGDVVRFVASSHEAFEEELRTAAQDLELVVVAGGDGTFSLTVNALRDRLDDVTFALIPLGTGNDLATTLGLPDDPNEAAAALAHGKEKRLDVGRVKGAAGEWLFINACVGGFSVDVDEALEEGTKRKLGRLAFWVGGLKAATDVTRYRARVDDRDFEDCVVAGVGIGRTVGGGLELWPEARPDDGQLDAAIIAAPTLRAGAKAAMKVKGGTHAEDDDVTMLSDTAFDLDAEPAMEFNVDGELVGLTTPLSFEVAGSYRMRVPEPPS